MGTTKVVFGEQELEFSDDSRKIYKDIKKAIEEKQHSIEVIEEDEEKFYTTLRINKIYYVEHEEE